MRYKSTISILITLLFILPTILLGVTSLVPVEAQGLITSVPDHIYPGETLPVTVNVPIAAAVTVTVTNAATGEEYGRQTFYAPMPGTYTVNIPIPKSLPNIGTADPPTLLVTVDIPFIGSDFENVEVYPLIEVTPIASQIVDELGNAKTVLVTGYGFPEGTEVTEVVFTGLSDQGTFTYPVDYYADEYGVVGPIEVSLLDITGFGIPAGGYSITFTSTASMTDNAKTPVFTVIPQLVILNNYGHGIDGEEIYVVGYGFPMDAVIASIKLVNTNFTYVAYSFPVNATVDEYGYLGEVNLKDYFLTNMTAGLYIPVVYLSGGSSYTFRNTYYLVRPLLCYVEGGVPQCEAPAPVLRPGETVTIVAYGYGPGADWGYPSNTLSVSFDKELPLTTTTLGKDGNATFTVTIPDEASAGAHYIWGVDSWNYEYSLAVIITNKAYWVALSGLDKSELPDTKVSAGYPGMKEPLKVCPCPENIVGYGYCAECVVYGGECDYLGDYIKVVIVGLYPRENFDVYFGGIKVASGTANERGSASVEFLVPTLPEGDYDIVVVGEITGSINIAWLHNGTVYTATVYPKILALSLSGDYLPVIVGSGIVRFIGTGFRPGITFTGLIVNNTDALLPLTTNVLRWTTDSSGLLVGYAGTTPAVLIPMIHPGKYELKLAYKIGDEEELSKPTYVYVVNNISRLLTSDNLNEAVSTITSVLSSISSQISSIGSSITVLDGKLTNVNSTLADMINSVAGKIDSVSNKVDNVTSSISNVMSTLSSKIDTSTSTLSDKIDNVASNVNSKAESILSKLDSIANAISGINLSEVNSLLNTINGKINSLATNVSNIAEAVNTVSGKVDNVASTLNTVNSKIDNVNTALSGKIDSVSNKVDNVTSSISNVMSTLSSKIDTSTSTLSDKIDNVASNVNSKVDAVSGKVDTAISTANNAVSASNNAFYIGLVAVIFALLATVFALLAYLTVRRSIVSK